MIPGQVVPFGAGQIEIVERQRYRAQPALARRVPWGGNKAREGGVPLRPPTVAVGRERLARLVQSPGATPMRRGFFVLMAGAGLTAASARLLLIAMPITITAA